MVKEKGRMISRYTKSGSMRKIFFSSDGPCLFNHDILYTMSKHQRRSSLKPRLLKQKDSI